ncbi:unnamed protein product [Rhizophagus irregularis]|nr:unnamed protein product [Rhizophagus irregularis]
MIKENRKADEAFDADYNYVYDIVKNALENPTELRKESEEDFRGYSRFIKGWMTVSDEPASKKCRVEERR